VSAYIPVQTGANSHFGGLKAGLARF
jgi:hypothetical protein